MQYLSSSLTVTDSLVKDDSKNIALLSATFALGTVSDNI